MFELLSLLLSFILIFSSLIDESSNFSFLKVFLINILILFVFNWILSFLLLIIRLDLLSSLLFSLLLFSNILLYSFLLFLEFFGEIEIFWIFLNDLVNFKLDIVPSFSDSSFIIELFSLLLDLNFSFKILSIFFSNLTLFLFLFLFLFFFFNGDDKEGFISILALLTIFVLEVIFFELTAFFFFNILILLSSRLFFFNNCFKEVLLLFLIDWLLFFIDSLIILKSEFFFLILITVSFPILDFFNSSV